MAETLVLKAEKRTQTGTSATRKQRIQGLVPAIIYGHKQEPVAVTLNHHGLTMEVKHHHRLLDVELDGKNEKFLVKEIQYDHLGDTIIHVDLTRVDLDERVMVNVEIELKGIPEGVTDGGMLDQKLAEIQLECLVTAIPEKVRANIVHLKAGDTLTAGELELSPGAKLITEPDATVATVRVQAEEVEEEAVEETDAAEPEIIAREKSEEEDKQGS